MWAIGDGDILVHWNGASWSAGSSGMSTAWRPQLWGSGPNDIWAVATVANGGLIRHWNGAAWSTSQSGPVGFQSIWGSGPENIWVTSCNTTSPPNGVPETSGEILHWDGTSWSKSLSGTTACWGIWGSGPANVWAVGGSVDGAETEHWTENPGRHFPSQVFQRMHSARCGEPLRTTFGRVGGRLRDPLIFRRPVPEADRSHRGVAVSRSLLVRSTSSRASSDYA